MPLPPFFTFSQSNLQDFADCPRRFELRYIQQLKWPALQSEPVLEQEHLLQQGQRFHELVHQHLLGIPAERLSESVKDPGLREWWENFLQFSHLDTIPGKRYPEFTLSAPFAGYRLLAKYDLLIIHPGERALIFDWKTSQSSLPVSYLRKRLQTRLYPFLLTESGAWLNNGQTIQPEQVEMIYWFAASPNETRHFPYSQKQFQQDRDELQRLIQQITSLPDGRFILTRNEKLCEFCVYRSLCNRGKYAGNWQQQEEQASEEDRPLEIDFDQIAEIEF